VESQEKQEVLETALDALIGKLQAEQLQLLLNIPDNDD